MVCLLDSTSEVHQALQGHLDALQTAKGHMSKALHHLEAGNPGKSMEKRMKQHETLTP